MPGLLATLTVSAMSPEARRSFAEFEKRVEAEDPEALYRMSVILEQGYDSIPRDSIRSISLLIKSAEKGFGEAQNYLGYLYRRGNACVRIRTRPSTGSERELKPATRKLSTI